MSETAPSPEPLSTEDLARLAAELASDHLASDVVLLDLRDVSDFADFFIIATGETGRHLDAIADDLTRQLRNQGLHIHHREGVGQGGWILLDFPGFVVHLFSRETREHYRLDELWSRATELVRIQ